MSCLALRLVSGRRVALVALTVAIGGCSPTNPSYIANVPFSSTDVVTGTGTEALVGKVLAVDYAGYLYNASQPENKGTLFDTSLNTNVISFQLGAGTVIRGWDEGLAGMRIGGQRRLTIPPDFGYGWSGRGPIPPNATLVFDVWLLGVFEPGEDPQ
jgi:FKBP-type peptidyl-prolyl cis-trans isomerase FkpA